MMLGVPAFTLTMERMFQDVALSLERLLMALRG
jgi:hypothetical protein